MCAQKLARLQAMVAERTIWAEQIAQIRRLHTWLLEVEHILDGSPTAEGDVVSHATVGRRLENWCEQMTRHLHDGNLSELEQKCLTEFFQVLAKPAAVPCAMRRPGGVSTDQS